MPKHELYPLLLKITWIIFAFAYGSCVGSLINVLVYRLPRGLGVITPSSRCPFCSTKLTWRENIPVFGWLMLRGRCRFCKAPISPEYPIVEAIVGGLFVLFFVLWYAIDPNAVWLGLDFGAMRPEWAGLDRWHQWPRETWPIFLVILTLVASLVAMTLVDLRTFTIPIILPWVASVVGLVLHTGHAAWFDFFSKRHGLGPHTADGYVWAIPTPGDWGWAGASIGAIVGIVLSLLLLRLGVITRSFGEDYDAWEKENYPEARQEGDADEKPTPTPVELARRVNRRGLLIFLAGLATLAIGVFLGQFGLIDPAWAPAAAGLLLAPFAGAIVARAIKHPARGEPERPAEQPAIAESGQSNQQPGKGEPQADTTPTDAWIQYPHARREMIRELAFLAPPALFALAGAWLARTMAGDDPAALPLWVDVLAGVLLGYLVGGAVVWAIRIFGSLAFGKEAMGMGDVHLMAGVGACLGWIDATLAFFLAAFVGMYWLIVSRIASGSTDRAIPYGPYLAAATLLVVLAKPLIETGLTVLFKIPPDMPPIDLP